MLAFRVNFDQPVHWLDPAFSGSRFASRLVIFLRFVALSHCPLFALRLLSSALISTVSMSSTNKICNGCKKSKPITDFPLKKAGGTTRWARCVVCRVREGSHAPDGKAKPRETRTYKLDHTLPLTPLASFLDYLSAQNSSVKLESRVAIPDISPDVPNEEKLGQYKKRADKLKDLLNEAMPYRFTYVHPILLNIWNISELYIIAIVINMIMKGVVACYAVITALKTVLASKTLESQLLMTSNVTSCPCHHLIVIVF